MGFNETQSELAKAYKKISPRYLQLKTKPWKDFIVYLQKVLKLVDLPNKGLIYDVGGGNGRNLLAFTEGNWEMFLIDFSYPLLHNSIDSSKNYLAHINADMCSLPLQAEIADFVLCIAAIHHLDSKELTKKVFTELYRIMNKGSFLILSVWRKWKRSTTKKMFKDLLLFPFKKIQNPRWRHGDYFLPWKNKNGVILAKRYYHLFTKRELKKFIEETEFSIIDLSVLGGKGGKDNIFVLLQK